MKKLLAVAFLIQFGCAAPKAPPRPPGPVATPKPAPTPVTVPTSPPAPTPAAPSCPATVDRIAPPPDLKVMTHVGNRFNINVTFQTSDKAWINANGFAGRIYAPLGPEGSALRPACELELVGDSVWTVLSGSIERLGSQKAPGGLGAVWVNPDFTTGKVQVCALKAPWICATLDLPLIEALFSERRKTPATRNALALMAVVFNRAWVDLERAKLRHQEHRQFTVAA